MKDFKRFILEGGNAVEGVGKIADKDIDPTIRHFKRTILDKIPVKISSEDLLGSAYKKSRFKSDYGDIDVAIDVNQLPKEAHQTDLKGTVLWLANRLTEIDPSINKASKTLYTNTTFKLVSIAFPIVNSSNGTEKVQIDFMLTADPKYTRFFLRSPTKKEEFYKKGGLYRSLLLSAVTKRPSKNIATKCGQSFAAEGLILSGTLAKDGSREIITDPQQVTDIIFGGKNVDMDVANSFMSIWNYIKSSPEITKSFTPFEAQDKDGKSITIRNDLDKIKIDFERYLEPRHRKEPEVFPYPTGIIDGW